MNVFPLDDIWSDMIRTETKNRARDLNEERWDFFFKNGIFITFFRRLAEWLSPDIVVIPYLVFFCRQSKERNDMKNVIYLMMLIWIVSISKIMFYFLKQFMRWISSSSELLSSIGVAWDVQISDSQYTPTHNQLIDIDILIPRITIDSINLMKR